MLGFGTGKCRGTKALNSFSIIPRVYESELNDKYGITLGLLKNGEESGFRGDLNKNVSFRDGGNSSPQRIKNEILGRYESVPGFCSMKIENEGELEEHVKNIHELSYSHYVFGKEDNIKGSFPDMCCGKSSRNLFLTLMEKGYPNSSFFYNDFHDHAYVGLPFVFGEDREKGFIIVDPTSDQLFYDKKNAPRNSLFVASGAKWKYEADWKGGADLFPSAWNLSRFSNLHTIRNNLDSSLHESWIGMGGYFTKVFKNPVDVDLLDR